MRLFTAIELGDDARAAIADVQRRVRADLGEAAGSLRFVRAEHLHLTLVFIGEVAGDRAAAIAAAMRPDISQTPFELVLGGTGTFPPRGRPRVLWLGTRAGEEESVLLHAAVARRLSAAGVAVDPRPFHPHLTLARWRVRGRPVRPRADAAEGAVARVRVGAVTLFESRLSSAGPTYTPLVRARLS